MEDKYVTIRAKVIRNQNGVLTVNLDDGFAQAEVVVDEQKAIAI